MMSAIEIESDFIALSATRHVSKRRPPQGA
jgi:hypothetical protein